MKKKLILIIGILIALIAIWQSVMGENSFREIISQKNTPENTVAVPRMK